jgi:hypothetical protein
VTAVVPCHDLATQRGLRSGSLQRNHAQLRGLAGCESRLRPTSNR